MAWQKETPDRKIFRLVRCAYNEAALGNEAKARSLWASAINAGYDPNIRGAKGFEIAIARGLREYRR